MPGADEIVTKPSRAPIRSFKVVERYGFVWICLGEPARDVLELQLDRVGQVARQRGRHRDLGRVAEDEGGVEVEEPGPG